MQIKDLKFDSRNYRRHNDKNKELIKKSIDEVGYGRSIVIDSENEVICGNGVLSQTTDKTPIKIVETDGNELIVVKRTDLKTDDLKRKQLAVMDNSASDSSDFDLALLQEDFDVDQLNDWGFNFNNEIEIDNEELMNNEELQEMHTNKMLALSKMPLSQYIVIHFEDDFTKKEWIEKFAKKYNPDTDITEKTQFCTWEFYEKDMSAE